MEGNPNLTKEEGLFQEATVNYVIDALELARQIHPLLDDYFCGSFAANSKGVLMKMDNGQVFQLTVTEVA